MSKIFYVCPTVNYPSGGIKLLYRHVFHLNRIGFEAYIIHTKETFAPFKYEYKVPILWFDEIPFYDENDIVVIPEGMPGMIKSFGNKTKRSVVIALNWLYIYLFMNNYENWCDWGITRAISPSPMIKNFVEWSMNIPTTLIQDYIDTRRYQYQPSRKKDKISFMSRKSVMGQLVCKIINKKRIPVSNFEWRPLEHFDESTYANHLIESKIYMACSSYEGVNMSVLEAMSAGCLVIGFAGVGGKDYMVGEGPTQNCILVENEDLYGLGNSIEIAIKTFTTNPQAYQHVINNGITTAARYDDFDREAASLKSFFSELLSSS